LGGKGAGLAVRRSLILLWSRSGRTSAGRVSADLSEAELQAVVEGFEQAIKSYAMKGFPLTVSIFETSA